MEKQQDLRSHIRFYFDGQLRTVEDVRTTDMVMRWLRSEAISTGRPFRFCHVLYGACSSAVWSVTSRSD